MAAKFKLAVSVVKEKSFGSDRFFVEVEGSGFIGKGDGYSIQSAFTEAYDDLTTKLLEGTSS